MYTQTYLLISISNKRGFFFTVKPENTTITNKTESNVVGNSATITCSSKGRPEPWYNITHNDTMLVSTSETYTISETKWSDAGKYTCFAWNKVGNDSASVYLTLTGKIRFLDTLPYLKVIKVPKI
jgi:hypothetical protein